MSLLSARSKAICWVIAIWIMELLFTGPVILPSAPQDRADQQTEQPRLAFDISVILKTLDVVVRDKGGRPIHGLESGNFKVFEDGVPRNVTHFLEVKRAVPSSTLPNGAERVRDGERVGESGPEAVQNRIVIFFDNPHCHPMNRNGIIKKLQAFILERFKSGSNNQAMVVFLDQGLEIVQDFTPNAADLVEAVQSVRGRASDALARARSWETIQQDIIQLQSRSAQGSDAEAFMAAVSYANGFIEEEVNRLIFSLGSLQALAGRLAGIKGRKIVIYASDRLPMNPAEEVYRFISRLYPSMSAETESLRHDLTDHFRRTIAVCNALDISVYALQAEDFAPSASSADKVNWSSPAGGLRPITPGSNMTNDGSGTLSVETGGSKIIAKRESDSDLRILADDLDHYYSLGYRSDAPADDSIHIIDVRLVGVTGDHALRFRTGYLKSSEAEALKNRVISRLFLPQTENPLAARIQSLPAKPLPFNRSRMRVKILIPISQISLANEGEEHVGSLKILAAMMDSRGKWSEPEELSQDVRIPGRDLSMARASSFPYLLELHVKPDRYVVSLAIMDVHSRIVSYLQFAQDVR